MLPQLPRLVHCALENNPTQQLVEIRRAIDDLDRTQRFQSMVLLVTMILAAGLAGTYVYLLFFYPFN